MAVTEFMDIGYDSEYGSHTGAYSKHLRLLIKVRFRVQCSVGWMLDLTDSIFSTGQLLGRFIPFVIINLAMLAVKKIHHKKK